MLDERVKPSTARYAVLGRSLPHTWSPYIHNSLFTAAELDAVYLDALCEEIYGLIFDA